MQFRELRAQLDEQSAMANRGSWEKLSHHFENDGAGADASTTLSKAPPQLLLDPVS